MKDILKSDYILAWLEKEDQFVIDFTFSKVLHNCGENQTKEMLILLGFCS